MSDIEGKAAQGSGERLGRGVSFKPDKKTVVLVTFIRVNLCASVAEILTSAQQSCHLNDGCVEDVEDELRREANGEHEQRDGHNHERLGSPEIGKPAATLRQRTAEERLHRTRKHDCCDEKTDHGNGRERSGDGEGTFED